MKTAWHFVKGTEGTTLHLEEAHDFHHELESLFGDSGASDEELKAVYDKAESLGLTHYDSFVANLNNIRQMLLSNINNEKMVEFM